MPDELTITDADLAALNNYLRHKQALGSCSACGSKTFMVLGFSSVRFGHSGLFPQLNNQQLQTYLCACNHCGCLREFPRKLIEDHRKGVK